jgi:hypothetical protein
MAGLTIGTGRREFGKGGANWRKVQNYALFMGGVNATHESLQAYDPFVSGRARLFMVQTPMHIQSIIGPDQMNGFKHILEYGCTAISGLSDISVDTDPLTGGYNGLSFEIPKSAKDDTNSLTITCYEFSGLPIRTILHTWINSALDIQTGLSTYYGDDSIDHIQANQTAEFIYVVTDNTGKNVEYACLFANCFPKKVDTDFLNYSSGQHDLVSTQIEFTATKYESIQINYVAKALLAKYRILSNSLNMHSGYAVEGKYEQNNTIAKSNEVGYSANDGIMYNLSDDKNAKHKDFIDINNTGGIYDVNAPRGQRYKKPAYMTKNSNG